jgi:hypothetical protein
MPVGNAKRLWAGHGLIPSRGEIFLSTLKYYDEL